MSLSAAVRARRFLLRLVAVLVVAVGVPVVIAGPASAHHPSLFGSVDCNGVVTLESKSWTTGPEGINPDIGVYRVVDGQPGQLGERVGGGSYNPETGYQFTITQNLGEADIAWFQARADGRWGNDYEGGQLSNMVTAQPPASCETAAPAASIEPTCTGYTGELDNSASNVPVTFTVTVNGTSTDHTVPAGGKKPIGSTSFGEDDTVTVTVKHGGTVLTTRTFTIDCRTLEPRAELTATCTGYTGVLDNSRSNVDLTFTVVVGGVATAHPVKAGDTKIISSSAYGEGDTVPQVRVEHGAVLVTLPSFTIDCAKPAATLSPTCTGFTALLDNSASTVPATFTIFAGDFMWKRDVAAGEKVVFTPPMEFGEGDTVPAVQVSHDGDVLDDQDRFVIDCEQPAASVTNTCTTYTATLDNSKSAVPVTYTVTFNGTTTKHDVPAGQTEKFSGPVTEGSNNTVTVSHGDTVLTTSTFAVDCAKPAATVTNTCATYTVTLDNRLSTVPVTFTVTVNGVATPHEVAAGQTKTVTAPVTEGTAYTVSVVNGTESLAQASFTVDCARPTALLAQSCAGYDATLDNSASTVPVEFIVTVNGVEQRATVPAGQTQHVAGPVVEDSTNTITVRAGGVDLVSSTFTQDCQTVRPAAALVHDCTSYTVTLNNAGSNAPVDFTVTVNGADQVVSVPAGQTQPVSGAVTEDGTYNVSVTGNGVQLTTGSFTVDCVRGGGGGGGGNDGNGGNGGGGDNGGGGGGGVQGDDASDDTNGDDGTTVVPTSAPVGGLPSTGSPALLGLALFLGLGLVAGGGYLTMNQRRRAHVR